MLTPHEYQRNGVDYWLRKKRCYWAVDMGLGKTIMTLLGLKKIGRPALVIAPLRTISTTWPGEIEKWGLDLKLEILHGKHKAERLQKKADIYVINFEGIKWLYDELVKLGKQKRPMPFSELVIDEGTMVKSASTKRFKMLRALLVIFTGHRLILSGTPSPNGLQDLWSQYFLLDEGEALETNFNHFKNKYFRPVDFNGYVWEPKPGCNKKIQDKVQPMTYRLDAEDYLELPEQVNNKIEVALKPGLMKGYKELEREFYLDLNDMEIEAFNKASLSMKLRQYLQGAVYYDDENGKRKTIPVHKEKLNALKELVESAGQPILCAIQFKFELEMIRSIYPDVPVIAGGTLARDATRYIKEWNEGKIPLLICHPASLSHGVNLQHGGHIILWYSQTWNAEHYLQLNGRLRRQGQEETVIVHHLIVKGTIDERIYNAIAKKRLNQQALLDYLRERVNE